MNMRNRPLQPLLLISTATHLGYSLHAQVRLGAHDRRRLEKLARYVLRPPICPQRLCDFDDGRLGYALKRPWSMARPWSRLHRRNSCRSW